MDFPVTFWRIGSTPYLVKRSHKHDPFTKTNKTSCCDARAAPFVSSSVPACSEASFGKLAPEKKQPSFLRLASQQGKP